MKACHAAHMPNSPLKSLSGGSCASTLRWQGGLDGSLILIDQTLLPVECKEIECRDVESVWEAIRSLASPRGAGDRHRGRLWSVSWSAANGQGR